MVIIHNFANKFRCFVSFMIIFTPDLLELIWKLNFLKKKKKSIVLDHTIFESV